MINLEYIIFIIYSCTLSSESILVSTVDSANHMVYISSPSTPNQELFKTVRNACVRSLNIEVKNFLLELSNFIVLFCFCRKQLMSIHRFFLVTMKMATVFLLHFPVKISLHVVVNVYIPYVIYHVTNIISYHY